MRVGELSKLLEGTADAAFAVDQAGEVVTWNSAAESLFGVLSGDAVGKPCAEIIGGRTASDLQICRSNCGVLSCAAVGRAVGNFDMRAVGRDDRSKWVNISILLVSDDRSGRRYSVHFARDIEDRKRSDELSKKMLQIAQSLVNGAHDTENAPPVVHLTEREREILTLMAAGKTTVEIAEALEIRARTLRNHISNINQKLNSRNRLEAVIQAVRNGMI